jgi:toxin ParE1/3/4
MIRWTEQALSDLEHLHDYISKDKPDAAARIIDMILSGLKTVEAFPEAGRKGTRVAGTRELVLYPYIVIYRRKRDSTEVLAVIHGSRRWPE